MDPLCSVFDSSLFTPKSKLLDIMADHSLQQMQTKPTRANNTLDLVFTNAPSKILKITTMPPLGSEEHCSDHDMLYIELNIPRRGS